MQIVRPVPAALQVLLLYPVRRAAAKTLFDRIGVRYRALISTCVEVSKQVTPARRPSAYRSAILMANSRNHGGSSSSAAAKLQGSCRPLHFTPQLEADYARARLQQNRTLIRVTCGLGALLVGLLGLQQALSGAWTSGPPLDFLLVFSSSLTLTYFAWSTAFERAYLPWATVIVPIRNSIMAAQIAEAAAHGQMDLLMGLPMMLIGPFFFLGLRFRTAVICGTSTALTFIVFAAWFGLAPDVATRACVLLFMGLIACIISARNIDLWSRTSFLETQFIADLAQHDALTGTKNRRIFDEHLTRLWPQAIDAHRSIAILLIDVDHFKAYNDTYGHQAGDRTLHQIAQAMQTVVNRPLDVLARYGGEEFVAVLYDVDTNEATATADRIRRAVSDLSIEHRDSKHLSVVTISIGVAIVEPTQERDPRGALQLADQALYEAKRRGRNRIELMNETQYKMLVTGIFSRDAVRAAR